MENQWVVLGPSLGLKNMSHRLGIQTIGPQAIHRLCWDSQKAAPADNLRRSLDLLPLGIRIRNVKNLRFHPLFASLSV